MRPFAHSPIVTAFRFAVAGVVCLCAAASVGNLAWAQEAEAPAAEASKPGQPASGEAGAASAKSGGDPNPADGGAKLGDGEAKPADGEAKPADGDAGKRSSLTRELAEQGEADLFKSVRVFQQRYLVKSKRVELVIGGATSFADPLIHHFSADAALLFHLNEHWAIGGGASKWFGAKTEGFDQIAADYGLFPEESRLQAGGWGEVQFSPVAGKFSGFGLGVLQGDAYLLAGGGAARTTRGESIKPYGLVGTGVRMHIARWLSLSMELRDMVMVESFLDNQSRVLQHWFGGVKLGIWLPPSVQYKYPR